MRRIVSIAGILAAILGVAAFNQWNRLHRHTDIHTQMAVHVRQGLVNRGIRPLSWEVLRQTRGGFDRIPGYPPEVTELAGRQVTIVGYGMPLGAGHVEHHDHHHHASLWPIPVLDLLLGHVQGKRYQGVNEFIFTPLPLDCYWRELPYVNEVIYVRTLRPIEFGDGVAIALTGRLELREQEGPKFFYVLNDAELLS